VGVPSRSLPAARPPEPVTLTAWYSHPAAAAPVPAVLLMHGCSGPGRNLPQWRGILHELGYAVLSLDSFGGRGVKEICSDFSRVSEQERQGDAFAALEWLVARPEVAGDRIAVVGFSHGGGIALDVAVLPPPALPGFRAAIAFYPACRPPRRKSAEYRIPLLILIGEADDWTPVGPCRDLARLSRGGPIDLRVYPEALHGFDVGGLAPTLRPGVRNLNSPTGWGSVTGEHPAARAAAIEALTGFLRARL
jgi:dienelactone hydrolase